MPDGPGSAPLLGGPGLTVRDEAIEAPAGLATAVALVLGSLLSVV